MSKNDYKYNQNSFRDATSITPNDSADLPRPISGFCISVAGDIVVDTALGNTVTLTCCTVGTVYNLAICRVRSTGTTATGIIGFI